MFMVWECCYMKCWPANPRMNITFKKIRMLSKTSWPARRKPTGRIDLKNIPEITERSINRDYNQRFPDVMQFVRVLQANLPGIPAERKSFRINWKNVLIVLLALMAVSLILVLAMSFIPV